MGRIGDLVVFIPFTAPEEEIEIEITQCKKKFARGRILKILKASPLRVAPLCNYYGTCGGCCYQHVDYALQLQIKRSQVGEAFVRIGKFTDPPVEEIRASFPNYHYRGKAQYHLAESADGCKPGFLDVSGGRIIGIERCELMEETINEKAHLPERKSPARAEKDTRFTVWADLPDAETNSKGPVVRLVHGKKFLVPRDGFFQNNLFLTNTLVDDVLKLGLRGKIDTALDIYCGCGLFSVFLASFAERVIGIELNKKAIRYAGLNAAGENIKNINFICGDAGEELLKRDFLSLGGRIDLLVLDPPRAGCSPSVLQATARLLPQRIVYVSCNPATQARDIRSLVDAGYELSVLRPLDMFPQTGHIEVIAALERRQGIGKSANCWK